MFKLFRRLEQKINLTNDAVQIRRRRLTPQPDAWMSQNARATCVAAIVDDQPDWDYAQDNEKALEYVNDAAVYLGLSTQFTDEQQDLAGFLVTNFAGPKICVYAWGVYLDICGSEITCAPVAAE